MKPQDPPFAIQIEPTEGCSLACSFCALQSIRDNGADAQTNTHGKNSVPYRFLSIDIAERIAGEIRRLGWNPRIEFAMHGEPTMNSELPAIIEVFRDRLPGAYMLLTTNGSGIQSIGRIYALFYAGLNTIAFDAYQHAPWTDKVGVVLSYYAAQYGLHLYRYPSDKRGNPHARHKGEIITILQDISLNSSGTHKLTNQGSNSFASLTEPLKQRCAKPFRELSINWNGNVALCCDDWRGEYKIGNVLTMKLDEIWQHPRFQAARRMLYHANRAFGPCQGCNVRTYRNGLLPDKFGKDSLPKPNEQTAVTIRGALYGKVFNLRLKP